MTDLKGIRSVEGPVSGPGIAEGRRGSRSSSDESLETSDVRDAENGMPL